MSQADSVNVYFFVSKMKAWSNFFNSDHFPDVICANSLFWDVTKYKDDKRDEKGNKLYPEFRRSLSALCEYIMHIEARAQKQDRLQKPCLRIWRSSMPLSRRAVGGFLGFV